MKVWATLVVGVLPLVARDGVHGMAVEHEMEAGPQSDGGDRQLQQTSTAADLDPNPDVWIVEFHPDTVGVAAIASDMAQAGQGRVGFVYEHAMRGFVYHGRNVAPLRRDPRVRSVTRDAVSTVAAQTTPTGVQRIYADTKRYMRRASASFSSLERAAFCSA